MYCRTNIFISEGRKLRLSKLPYFKRTIRFQLMIYTPSLIWRAETSLDYMLTEKFNFPNWYRDLLNIIQLCGDMNGRISWHDLCTGTSTRLSHVLCSPVQLPDPHIEGEMDLTALLGALRRANPTMEKAYTLEQIVLLPTI